MKKQIIDKMNDRTIICDFSNDSILIKGDFSSSSITTYWVVNRFNTGCPVSISITREHAELRCRSYNEQYSTNTFYITRRTIFI